ncbi:MAG: hypothetical protein ABIG11_10925 [bacterium]
MKFCRKYCMPALVACAIIAAVLTAFRLGDTYRPPMPRPDEIAPFADSSMFDAFAVALGLRRLAADISFIRLMQYYGTSEHSEEESGHCHHGEDYGGDEYPEFFERARHVLDLDPYFRHAVLYAAGALAFNLGLPDEAVELITRVRRFDPKEWKYSAYLAAIGYKGARNPRQVADTLYPVIEDPECPTMIKQLVAFLSKRIKRYHKAAEIYEDIIRTSKDEGYIRNARQELQKLRPMLK